MRSNTSPIESSARTALVRARVSLSEFILQAAAQTMLDTGIALLPDHEAPSTWQALQAVDLSAGLPVFDLACDQTIYSSAAVNVAFRYWHDLDGHLAHGLSFTPEDETELQLEHHLPALEQFGFGPETLEYAIYRADTIGQIEYVVKNHTFPVDQLTFALNYVSDRSYALDMDI